MWSDEDTYNLQDRDQMLHQRWHNYERPSVLKTDLQRKRSAVILLKEMAADFEDPGTIH
jgi:hypothetical protein